MQDTRQIRENTLEYAGYARIRENTREYAANTQEYADMQDTREYAGYAANTQEYAGYAADTRANMQGYAVNTQDTHKDTRIYSVNTREYATDIHSTPPSICVWIWLYASYTAVAMPAKRSGSQGSPLGCTTDTDWCERRAVRGHIGFDEPFARF